jgi:hypothetical protein
MTKEERQHDPTKFTGSMARLRARLLAMYDRKYLNDEQKAFLHRYGPQSRDRSADTLGSQGPDLKEGRTQKQ